MNGSYDAAGNGHLYGHATLDVCNTEFGCGTFEGPHKTEAVGFQGSLRLNGHGTGDFHTLQIRFVMVEQGNSEIFDAEGVIF